MDQLLFILADPLKYVMMIILTTIAHGLYIRSFIGNLGWLDTPMPLVIYLSYPLFLMASSFYDDQKGPSLSIGQRAWLLVIFVFGFLLIMTMLYLSWDPVGFGKITGVQGRYFIPIAPLFFLVSKGAFGIHRSNDGKIRYLLRMP